MIITLTLNPAIDVTVVVHGLALGDANRVRSNRTDPGGKGLNVSRVLRELGRTSLAMGLVAGGLGRFVEHTLSDLGILHDFVRTSGRTRTNMTIVDLKTGQQTSIRDLGPETPQRYVRELFERLGKQISPGDWLVVAGSIPPPLAPTLYTEIIAFAKERGAYTALDADEERLSSGLEAKPYLVKPNLKEISGLLGRPITTETQALEAAEELKAQGVEVVIVTMGQAGAIAVSSEGRWRVVPPEVEVVSSVGAGDALLAGVVLVLSDGGSLEEALRLGTAAGAAASLTPGTELCHSPDVQRLLPLVKVWPL